MTTSTVQDGADIEAMWSRIKTAGGRERFIASELERRGLLVERRPTERMNKRELTDYKRRLKAEAAAREELMQQTWQAYKAHHIVHLGEQVFWNDDADWDRFDHPQAEERQAANDLPRLDKPEGLAEALEVSMRELRWLTFHRDAARYLHYTRFTIPKATGGEREIWAPTPQLKAIQRWILREIVERLPVHGAAHGFVPGRSIATNAAQHTNSAAILKMDIKDFFPSVTLPRVKGVFRKAGYREQIATLLALLCTEAPREVVDHAGETLYVALGARCLPQGAPTSPAITNTLCLALDRRLTGLAAAAGWRYSRYADDLTFSLPVGAAGEDQLGRIIGSVKHILADEGFTAHPEKTRVLRPGTRQHVTGLVVNGDGPPRVPRTTRRMVRAAIHNLKQGKPLHEDESLHTLLGYAAYIYMTDPELGERMLNDLSGVVG